MESWRWLSYTDQLGSVPNALEPQCFDKRSCLIRDPSYDLVTGVEIVYAAGTVSVWKSGGFYRIQKDPAGASAYDSNAVSAVGLTGSFRIRVQATNMASTFRIVGISTTPTTSYTSILYGFEFVNEAVSYTENGGASGGVLYSGLSDAPTTLWINYNAGPAELSYWRGDDFATATQMGTTRTGVPPGTYFVNVPIFSPSGWLELQAAQTASAYTLVGDAGSYALTGTATGAPALSRRLVAATGSYALTGTATGLKAGRTIVATAGSYSLSGTATGAPAISRRIVAAPGSYALSSTAAALLRGRNLSAVSGSYTLSGTAAALKAARRLTATAGSYSLTGTAANLTYGTPVTLVAATGSYILTGQSATLRRSRSLAVAPGRYFLVGQPIVFTVRRNFTPALPPAGVSLANVTPTFGSAVLVPNNVPPTTELEN